MQISVAIIINAKVCLLNLNRFVGHSEYLLITYKITEFLYFFIEAKYSVVVQSFILTSSILKRLHFVCFVSSIPSLLLMVQRNPPQAAWYHLVLSWCTMVSEVKRQGVQESKDIDYAKQHHTPHCWLPATVMYPAISTKRFSWLTRSTSIFLMKNVQIYK